MNLINLKAWPSFFTIGLLLVTASIAEDSLDDPSLTGELSAIDGPLALDSSMESIQERIAAKSEERKALKSEVVYIRHKIAYIEEKLTSDDPLDAGTRETLTAELRQWQDRSAKAEDDLVRVQEEQAELFRIIEEISIDVDEPVLHGFRLAIAVAEDQAYNGEYEVRPTTGNLVLPGLPRMFVVGKTTAQIAVMIADELRAANLIAGAQVSVDVTYRPPVASPGQTMVTPEPKMQGQPVGTSITYGANEFGLPKPMTVDVLYFSGEVMQPGAWKIPGDFENPTLVKALLRMRLTDKADLARVRVLRLVGGSGLVEEVDVSAILRGESQTADFVVLPDDVIVVPAKGAGENILYLSGEFEKPGVWEIPTGFQPTLAQALLRVDLKDLADLEAVKVVRMTDNRAVVEEINVVKVLDGTGLTADFELQPKDIITVPTKKSAENVLYLSGQGDSPGVWEIPAGFEPTIAKTLLRVKLGEFADLSQVQVLRLVNGKGVAKTIDVARILQGQGLVPDFKLENNDIVTVPVRGSKVAKERQIFVRGEVGNPGDQGLPIDPTEEMTPYMAILMAGGPTANADLMNVELVRTENGQTVRRRVNVAAILAGEASDEVMRHKDVLIIPGKNRTKRVYLTGRIKQPGILEIPPNENQTLYASIVHRGGFDRFANLRKTYVLRDTGDGMRERIPVNIKALRNGFIPDLILEDNDIVVVPEKFFSWGGDNN